MHAEKRNNYTNEGRADRVRYTDQDVGKTMCIVHERYIILKRTIRFFLSRLLDYTSCTKLKVDPFLFTRHALIFQAPLNTSTVIPSSEQIRSYTTIYHVRSVEQSAGANTCRYTFSTDNPTAHLIMSWSRSRSRD